jgi:hypothetical protein
MRKLFGCLFLLITASFTSCLYKPAVDDNWVYFEDWDMNSDSRIDSAEFVSGYLRDDLYKDRFEGSVADKAGSAEEAARTNFTICDDDKDGLIRSLEFYHWELNRNPEPKRDTLARL